MQVLTTKTKRKTPTSPFFFAKIFLLNSLSFINPIMFKCDLNFRYVAETCPGNILAQRFYHFSDEVFVALDLTVSKHFLQNFGGLFTENFYGLARKETEIGKSILVHVILPYLKVKVERLYERWIIGHLLSRLEFHVSFPLKHPKLQGPIS